MVSSNKDRGSESASGQSLEGFTANERSSTSRDEALISDLLQELSAERDRRLALRQIFTVFAISLSISAALYLFLDRAELFSDNSLLLGRNAELEIRIQETWSLLERQQSQIDVLSRRLDDTLASVDLLGKLIDGLDVEQFIRSYELPDYSMFASREDLADIFERIDALEKVLRSEQ